MKIAFLTYPAAFQNIGGGEIQLLKVAEYLRKKEVAVDLFDTWRANIGDYDALHVFGSVKDCLGLVHVANARGVKVVNSPILWADWRHALHSEGSVRARAGLLLRHLAKVVFPAFPSSRREILLRSDLLLPNSRMECGQIARLFAVPQEKMRVVHNGVDASFLHADPGLFRKTYGMEPFILTVGRIEPRKNLLNLIRAAKGVPGARLVSIGSPVSGYEAYRGRCVREGEGFTRFLPALKHEDPLLGSAYAACALFVQPAWFETPGLAALEAALAGARVLATEGGSTREYFGDLADYLDPSDVGQMRRQIGRNFSLPPKPDLREHVRSRFTWERIADEYLASYQELLGAV